MSAYELKKQNWNLLDIVLFSLEKWIRGIVSQMKRHSEDNKEPDTELLINAAIEYLQNENEELKKKQYPGRILVRDKEYYCPDCNIHIDYPLLAVYKTKYCPECGKRIFLSPAYSYATSHMKAAPE